MKYEKGNYGIVPNKSSLEGLDPQTQVLFMWLCFHADENGVCWPSMTRLGVVCGMSRRIVVDRMDKLEALGLLTREKRYWKNKQRNNMYQIVLKCTSAGDALGVVQEMHHTSAGDAHRTISKELNPVELSPATGGKDVSSLIDVFSMVNPTHSQLFRRPPQRAAAERLLKLHDLGWWTRFIEAYAERITDKYCPKATTPIQLEEKLGAIIAYAETTRKEQSKRREVIM